MEEILELENRHAWPEAISLFCGMFNRLHDRLPQEKLTEEDYQLLTDDEYNELKGCLGEVVELMSRDKESFWRSYDNRKFPARDKDLTDKYHNDTSILALQIALKEPMDKLYNISAKVHRLKQAADEAAAKVADEVARKEKLAADEGARKEKLAAAETAKEARRNQADKTSLAEILYNHEFREGLPADVAKLLVGFRLEVSTAISPFSKDEEYTYAEFDMVLNTFLNDDDKAQIAENKRQIWEWLYIRKNLGEGYPPGISGVMFDLKKLIVKAFRARMEEQRALEEAEAKEEQRKWDEAESERIQKERVEAFKHVYPDQLKREAEQYLEKDDQEKLRAAVPGAIDVYLEEGDSFLDSYKTPLNYRRGLKDINYEKEKERRLLNAQSQAQAFRPRLAEGLKEIERKLSPKKEAPAVRFNRYCSKKGETRYLGESFADILGTGDRERNWTQDHITAAEEELENKIPEEFRDFILTESTATPFLLPRANYLHCGVACLAFSFDVFSVVTIKVRAKTGQKAFNGYPFKFLTNLREPRFLGFFQITIYPTKPQSWQSVPISLFLALIDGKAHAPGPGITIIERDNLLAKYQVKKFKDEICTIPISFERYCGIPGIIETMKEVGIIEERTAEMLASPQPISVNNKESKSKKAKVFKLFSEGKRPSDPEVKSLGIKPESAYRYYQAWKKLVILGNNRI